MRYILGPFKRILIAVLFYPSPLRSNMTEIKKNLVRLFSKSPSQIKGDLIETFKKLTPFRDEKK